MVYTTTKPSAQSTGSSRIHLLSPLCQGTGGTQRSSQNKKKTCSSKVHFDKMEKWTIISFVYSWLVSLPEVFVLDAVTDLCWLFIAQAFSYRVERCSYQDFGFGNQSKTITAEVKVPRCSSCKLWGSVFKAFALYTLLQGNIINPIRTQHAFPIRSRYIWACCPMAVFVWMLAMSSG